MLALHQNVSFSSASALVANGLRFTYKQLLSAVQAGVQGVQVWMLAYRELGISRPSDMPAVAEALCCNDHWVWHESDCPVGSSIADILSLAAAMPSIHTATGILQDICESGAADRLTVDELQQLLSAAIQLGHSCQVEHLLSLPAADQLTPEQLMPLMQSAIGAELTYSLRLLCESPAAAQLSVYQLHDLLYQAIMIRSAGSVRVLCGLPAADGLQAAAVRRLMQSVGDYGDQQLDQQQQAAPNGVMWALSQLPVYVSVA